MAGEGSSHTVKQGEYKIPGVLVEQALVRCLNWEIACLSSHYEGLKRCLPSDSMVF